MKQIKSLLSSKHDIVITTHVNPDGDAIGSSLALYNFLLKMNHSVNVIVPNGYPNFLSWMKYNDQVINYSKNKEKANQLIDESTIIFCLDFNNLNRIHGLGLVIENANSSKILIDHHLDPSDFYDYKIHDTNASATAELVYNLIQFINPEFIDSHIAECIYTGILTDTGSFKFPSTSSRVHRVVANLIDKGAEINKIHNMIYDNNSLDKLKLIGFSLSQKLEIISNGNAAYIVLSRKDLADYNYKKGDTEGLVNYALSISKVNMATLIIETKEKIKFSFRSVGEFSVNQFARDYFNGGGHKNAAGGSLEDKLSVALDKFLDSVSKSSNELNY